MTSTDAATTLHTTTVGGKDVVLLLVQVVSYRGIIKNLTSLFIGFV